MKRFTIGKQLSIILSTSERTTFLSIDTHTVFFPSAKDIVCTLPLSSHMNRAVPNCLLNSEIIPVLIARWENWFDVFIVSSKGCKPGLLSYTINPPLLFMMPTNLIY